MNVINEDGTEVEYEVLVWRYRVPELLLADDLDDCRVIMVSAIDNNTSNPVCVLIDGEPTHQLSDKYEIEPIDPETLEHANKTLSLMKLRG